MGTEREGAPGGRMGMKGGMGMQRQEAPGGRDGSEGRLCEGWMGMRGALGGRGGSRREGWQCHSLAVGDTATRAEDGAVERLGDAQGREVLRVQLPISISPARSASLNPEFIHRQTQSRHREAQDGGQDRCCTVN